MSTAIADGDLIYGVIAATAVQQNLNHTPVFVPNSPSLIDLFQKVVTKAHFKPDQISVVEAHGTGTPVGDPVEYESIRRVLGVNRTNNLMLGSVKGLIGHAECTSGMVSLVKILLMINKAVIPPQASFQQINPAIKATLEDHISIAQQIQPWDAKTRTALINNYGASGSNASMIVTQAPLHDLKKPFKDTGRQHPVWLSALDPKSLRAYSARLRQYIKNHKEVSLDNLAFNISRQSNRSLGHGLIFNTVSMDDFVGKLDAFESNSSTSIQSYQIPSSRPLILCFGGQVSNFIGLDPEIYHSIAVFRNHFDEVNSACVALGEDAMLPDVFQREPIKDVVHLQAMLFAVQYASAKSWIECGVKPVAIIGHSFGELTALCISGRLTLNDTLKIIIGRAKIIRDQWVTEKGAMMAVEGDLNHIQQLIDESNELKRSDCQINIACFNGPRSFTLAGPVNDIDRLATSMLQDGRVKAKKLNVTNAFHSSLVTHMMDNLRDVCRGVDFKEATIPLWHATENQVTEDITTSFVADHLRSPVYFNHVLQRLVKQYPSATFLEAGSHSTITNMAEKALGSPMESHFQAVNLGGDRGINNLSQATSNLWAAGVDVSLWLHHSLQLSNYNPLFLPPYQFERSRHWTDLKKVPKTVAAPFASEAGQLKPNDDLFWFHSYRDKKHTSPTFQVNTASPKYEKLLSGHIIAQTAPICPATVQIAMAIEAAQNLLRATAIADLEPRVLSVENHSAICRDPSRLVWMDFDPVQSGGVGWNFTVRSSARDQGAVNTTHTSGIIMFHSKKDPKIQLEFNRYERFSDYKQCYDLLQNPETDDIIQGRNIYRTFAEIVDYGTDYHGLQRLVGHGNQSAGRVEKYALAPGAWLDAHLADSFCQVGGIWVNCMTERDPSDMYIATAVEQWIRSPKYEPKATSKSNSWIVSARHHRNSLNSSFTTDIFVFDTISQALTEVVLGIKYVKIPKASMRKILLRLTPDLASPTVPVSATSAKALSAPKESIVSIPAIGTTVRPAKSNTRSAAVTLASVKAILAELCGLEDEEIKDDSDLADIGIDSLMGMEMAKEIEGKLKISLPENELVQVVDLPGLMKVVNAALSIDGDVSDTSIDPDDVSVLSHALDTPSDSETSVSQMSTGGTDIVLYLSEFLGIDQSEIQMGTILRDIGVDSLLSTEIREDMASKLGHDLPKDLVIEELTVSDLDARVNGTREVSKSVAIPPTVTRSTIGTGNESHIPPSTHESLSLPASLVMEAFNETKALTDKFISDFECDDYIKTVLPEKDQLCIALTIEAFEALGCSIHDARPGTSLPRISHQPQDAKLVDYLYSMLEKEAGVVTKHGDHFVRTAASIPTYNSEQFASDLIRRFPQHKDAIELTYYAGCHLAQIFKGETDGIRLIFGSEEGRKLVSRLYGDWPLNRLYYAQIKYFLTRLDCKLPKNSSSPLKILEMGAGTGGTTDWLVPLLATLKIPVEYTFTDLAPSFVAAARKRFKQYPFMKYRIHDIEAPIPSDLVNSQHIIIASNAVHATHSLVKSTEQMRHGLRSDGLLMMVEMTGTLYWVDMIFGLFEGWWLFDDGRQHAVADETRWQSDLTKAGYGYVDWTDGQKPENKVERLLMAMVSDLRYERSPSLLPVPERTLSADCAARKVAIDEYVRRMTQGFKIDNNISGLLNSTNISSHGDCILLTGATGSLGSHLVANLASCSSVTRIICLNRQSNEDAEARQRKSFQIRGISISSEHLAKLQVYETDLSKPALGLSKAARQDIIGSVTHIVHNAWLMSAKRSLKGFESQFHIMRNMLDLASDISSQRPPGSKVTFQFISSIAVVGHYPLSKQTVHVPEQPMYVEDILPNGYGDAKYICELMLDETLHKYPNRFNAMAVRIGQIAGSKISGYWNSVEHFPFLLKSSQTLNALPGFTGELSWTCVDDVAGTLADLLNAEHPYPFYHIDNPVRQQWSSMLPVLADALGIPRKDIIPFEDWVDKIRDRMASGKPDMANPAAKLIDFLDDNFTRMSCGGLLLQTKNTEEHSKTMREVGPIEIETARKFIRAWREIGFLA
jgi:malonyl CoA-acyl carrier protein transacylase/nucleoside-diphosphate-sugar epimerase